MAKNMDDASSMMSRAGAISAAGRAMKRGGATGVPKGRSGPLAGEAARLGVGAHAPRTNRKGGLIRRLQRHGDVIGDGQIGGHVWQRVADGDRLDVGARDPTGGRVAGDVSGEGQRLVGGELEFLLVDRVPDGFVN